MKVLIVDDDQTKVREILKALSKVGISEDAVDTAGSVFGAVELLKKNEYGLLVLDLVLPIRLSDEPSDTGGSRLLAELERKQDLHRPEHIVGLTVSAEALAKAEPEFSRGLWSIARYGPDAVEWKDALTEKARYLLARNASDEGQIATECDVLFICALARPELSQLKAALSVGFEEVQVEGDHTRYFQTEVKFSRGKVGRVVACSAPAMGLTAAAALTTKACSHFKPKIVTGLCS